ncbi:MAG TPA: lysine-2,3-aminomutase-like protein [Methylocella sp.]|nr:lysine-2,3-aminomutase-like protein [Methylocella sp.]
MSNFRSTLRSASDLVQAGLLPASQEQAIDRLARTYAIGITPALAAMIDPADARDPVGRQFVPSAAELIKHPDERADPTGDQKFSPVEGIVHRYPDRVLLKLLHTCPVYCRFCFRRAAVGPNGPSPLSPVALAAAIRYIEQHDEVWEVILTGGDPLVLSDRRLAGVMERLKEIDHVKILRLHTRAPVADPERVTAHLAGVLLASGKSVYVALHANHPRELSATARSACATLVDAGIPMVSQSVLLRGVNDDIGTLSALMRALVEARVKPYYLHHLDPAPGTAHFRVPIEKGRELMRQLHGRLSGLCQPRFVLDIPGGHGKSPIGPEYLRRHASGMYEITDYNGQAHALDADEPQD